MSTAGDNTMDQQTAAASDTFALRVRHVRTWAMATGHVAAPEALLLICEVKAAGEDPFDRWTLAHVDELLWAKLVGRCRSDGRPLPEYLFESLWTYLGYLAAHELIARRLLPGLRGTLR